MEDMLEIIYEKVIISRTEIEYYRNLDKPVLRDYKRRKREGNKKPKEQTEKSKVFSISHYNRNLPDFGYESAINKIPDH